MLKEYTIDEIITDLMKKCGLGAVIGPIEPVSGGLMHRMYRVRTDHGIYAVKHLNPKILAREGVHDNLDRAEKIECLLEKRKHPYCTGNNSKKMQNVNNHYFYIFNWDFNGQELQHVVWTLKRWLHFLTVLWQHMIIAFGHTAVCLDWRIPG